MVISKYEMEQLKKSFMVGKVFRRLEDVVDAEIKRALLSTNIEIKEIKILNCVYLDKEDKVTSIYYNKFDKQCVIRIKIEGFLSNAIDSAFGLLSEEYKKAGYEIENVDGLAEKGFRIYI